MPNYCRIFKDAGNQQMGIQVIDAVTGLVVANTSAIYLTIDDIESDGKERIAKFQLLKWKDATSCQVMQAYFLMTTPEPGT